MEKIVYDNSGLVNHFDYMKKNCKYNKLTRENYAVINKNTSFYYRKNPDADSINKSDIERGKSPRYDLAADPKGLTYTDEWCEKHREAALKNFDMNMEYYKQVGKEFEDRLKSIIDEVEAAGNVIIFIDEIHRLNRSVEEILYPAMEDYALDKEKIECLTKRELDVLRLISEGCSNKKISDELTISERTVKNHISHIFRKIDVEDRTQAAVFAIRNKIS